MNYVYWFLFIISLVITISVIGLLHSCHIFIAFVEIIMIIGFIAIIIHVYTSIFGSVITS